MKALKTKIRGLDKSLFKRLRELTAHAKNLYNQTLWTLRQAYEATGLYFSYPQMDKAMKQVKNLEDEVNYKLLKAKVSQQTLRRLDKNFKSFFLASCDFKKTLASTRGHQSPLALRKINMTTLFTIIKRFRLKMDRWFWIGLKGTN